MLVTVYTFGTIRRYVEGQVERLTLDLPAGSTIADLLERLQVPVGEVGIVGLNGEMAERTAQLADSDVVEVYGIA